MIAHKSGNSASAGNGMHFDLSFTEAPDRPACVVGISAEGTISFCVDATWPMPIISIRLDDESSLLKHEVGLPSLEYYLVHLELQPTFLELGIQETFNASHLLWEGLPKSGLANLLSLFRWHMKRDLAKPLSILRILSPPFQGSLAQFLSSFGRYFLAPVGSTYSLSRLWPQVSLAQYLTGRGRSFVNSSWHPMFNYNTR